MKKQTGNTITVNEILAKAETDKLCILNLVDASRYASNAQGGMLFNCDIWQSKRIGGYVKENLERILRTLINKGDVYMWFAHDERPICAEIIG